MDPILLGAMGLAVVAGAYWTLSRRRDPAADLKSRAGTSGSRRSFASPDGAFSLAYPAEWLTRERIDGPLSPGSAFVAMDRAGCMLLEAFLLGPNTLEFYAQMWASDQKDVHPDTRVLATTPFPLEGGREALRLTLTYTEGTIAGTSHPFTTDYFLIDAGSRVLSLNFKVLASRHDAMRETFEAVARSVRARRV